MAEKESVLDKIDLQILRELQANSRLTNKELAARIHLSTTPTFERQRRLEREGYISQYTAIVDAQRVGRGFSVFCNVSFSNINQSKALEFGEIVRDWEEVTECYNVSGDCDYMMKVCVADMRSYQQFILDKVGSLSYVERVRSVFIMGTLKLNYSVLPIERK
ncbi:MAG: Lrp/AsnC family transcriptional regulator [Bacteroidales bacterium]|nr:Lrp/AsnC family transcriptional regulator [Bacteroidales bacterium]MCD8388221.1 Lrp/AsnC family transcriptional regulator [Bacteroidales bacterium]